MKDEIKFYPAKFRNLYRNWMENIRDWCISRQLWWGHEYRHGMMRRGNVYVARKDQDCRLQALFYKLKGINDRPAYNLKLTA